MTRRMVNEVKRDVNAAQRVQHAIKLRMAKLPYAEIAARCGYGSAGAAHKAIQRELQRISIENVDELRREEMLLLDRLQSICFKLADDEKNKGRLFAVDRLLAISDRRSKLMGLNREQAGSEAQASAAVVIREVPVGYFGLPEQTAANTETQRGQSE